MAGFLTHMIQVRSTFLEYFLSDEFFHRLPSTSNGTIASASGSGGTNDVRVFEYYNTTQSADQQRRNRQWCPQHDDERGYFVALRKK